MRQMVLVLSRQSPYLILFLILSVISGAAFGLSVRDHEPLPYWLAAAWAVVLFCTGTLGLIGLVWQRWHLVRGKMLLRGVLMTQAGLVIMYSGIVGLYVPRALWLITLASCLTWAGVNVWESRLLTRDLGHIEEAVSGEQ